MSDSVTPWMAACQASPSFTISLSFLKLMYIQSAMPSNHLILCCPLLLLPSIFPSTKVLSNDLVLCIRWPKYWSFSINPSNEYSGLISFWIDWFDLLLSNRHSRVFSSTTVWKYQFFSIGFLYGPTHTSIHSYWKKPQLWLDGPLSAKRSKQSILKEINPEYSLEVLMLKLQYFNHLMQRANSLEKPWCWERVNAGGEGGNRGWDGWMALNILNMSLSKLWEMVKDREAWYAAVYGVTKSQTWLSDSTTTTMEENHIKFIWKITTILFHNSIGILVRIALNL